MNSIALCNYHSPLGDLLLGVFNNKLCLCDWKYRKQREQVDKRIESMLQANFELMHHPIHDLVINQLSQYFNGNLQQFNIPLQFCGSSFQQDVWKELGKIAYGTTVSYSTLSRKLNKPLAIRAIAAANGANAISIIIPCHRVIGKDGSLTGYAGGLLAKEKLLKIEGASWNNQQLLF